MNKKTFYIFLLITLIRTTTFATEYYCDPTNGSMSNTGSYSSPWTSLESVFNASISFQSGDIIYLLDGYHGNPNINGINSDYVTITNYQSNSPTLSRIQFGNAETTSYWILENIFIGAEYHTSYHQSTLVRTYSQASNILIKNCTIFSKETIDTWTIDDWNSKISNAVVFSGSECTIENSTIKNIRTGIQFDGNNCKAYGNIIQNFAGDGLRGLANGGIFEYNRVQDNYAIDTNHDDGFQSWTNDGGVGNGTIYGIVVRGNTFINYTDPTRDFLGPMQGIMCSDGMFENFIIENNIVITDHWHGISLYGATNCKIINNTVTDTFLGATYPDHPDDNNGPLGPSWIKIADHNGIQSTGNTLRNNITNQLVFDESYMGNRDHNLVVAGNNTTAYTNNFIDWQNNNLRLLATSTAIDTGSDNSAPTLDADKNPRPFGNGFDMGAYEFGSTSNNQSSSNSWQSFSMDTFSSIFTAEYDLIPNYSNMDGVTGILTGTATDYSDLSCIVRLNSDGHIDAYNTNTYAYDQLITYQAGDIFHVKIIIDIPNEIYDVYISKNAEDEVMLANDYGFRNITGTLNAWAIKSETGNHSIQNMDFYTGGLALNQDFTENGLFLNPTYNKEGIFQLSITNSNNEKIQIQLLDMKANKIQEIDFIQESNSTNFILTKYSTLPIGIYMILIKYKNYAIPVKVVKYN